MNNIHSKLFRTANQRKARALVSAHRDRGKRKRDLRRLWITRINAAARANGVSYNRFIQYLYKRQLLPNRKTLAFFSSVTESISLVSIDPKLFLLHKLNSFNLA